MPTKQPISLIKTNVAVIWSAAWFAVLLCSGRIRQPAEHKGGRLIFSNGTSARVFRETVADLQRPGNPAVLVVEYRLRALPGLAHAVFQRFSIATAPLFAGFPGFVSKLWLTADQNGVYRGIYEWDDVGHAESYAQTLRWTLRPVAAPGSIDYHVVANESRARFLAESECLTSAAPPALSAWWRPS